MGGETGRAALGIAVGPEGSGRMVRKILDENLESWESYATTGMFGYSEPARVVFRCLSDATERARALYMGDKAEAERVVTGSSDEELRELLSRAEPVD